MREITIPAQPAQTLSERIAEIRTVYDSNHIEVITEIGSMVGSVFVKSGEGQRTIINADAYDEIMRGAPEWALNKPANTFRDEDVFIVLDMIKAGELSNKK